MRATLNDIAACVGVSKSLVSMYLNNHRLSSRIATATKARIDAAVKELGYRASSTAQALSTGRTRLLGLVVGKISNSYFSHFAEAAMEEAAHHDCQLLISLTRGYLADEPHCLESLINRQVDGVLYCPRLCLDTAFIQELRERNYPLLLIDQKSDCLSTIMNDTFKAMSDAMTMLKRRGHRRVAGLFGESLSKADDFSAACEQVGMAAELLPHPNHCRKERLTAMKEICRLRPAAIVVNGHLSTAALLQEISQGYPEYHPDIVMSCGYWGRSLMHERIVGIVHCHSAQLVKEAVGTLVDMVGKPEDAHFRRVSVPADFVSPAEFDRLSGADEEDKFFVDY